MTSKKKSTTSSKGPLEKDIQREILQFLKGKPGYYWRNQSGGVFDPKRGIFLANNSEFSPKGVSDILGICDGRLIAIEVKNAKGKVSPEQVQFIERITAHGGVAFVARSVQDVEECMAHVWGVETNEKQLALDIDELV